MIHDALDDHDLPDGVKKYKKHDAVFGFFAQQMTMQSWQQECMHVSACVRVFVNTEMTSGDFGPRSLIPLERVHHVCVLALYMTDSLYLRSACRTGVFVSEASYCSHDFWHEFGEVFWNKLERMGILQPAVQEMGPLCSHGRTRPMVHVHDPSVPYHMLSSEAVVGGWIQFLGGLACG